MFAWTITVSMTPAWTFAAFVFALIAAFLIWQKIRHPY